MPLLEVTDLSVAYGGVQAVSGVSMAVEAGSITALIGPNGAGKTSFVDAVTGFGPCSGTVVLDGAVLDGLRPNKRARAGLARTWQNAELFDELTVLENVAIADDRAGGGAILREILGLSKTGPQRWDNARATLDRLGMGAFVDSYPDALTTGQLKLVSLARALAGSAKVVLMDEPAAGLDDDETAVLRRLLLELAAGGLGILLIEHDMDLVMTSSDVLYVIDRGRLIATGTAAEVRKHPAVLAAYLGDDPADPFEAVAPVATPVAP